MADTRKTAPEPVELDERTLDRASGGKAPQPPAPGKDGNVTGLDDWEKHNS